MEATNEKNLKPGFSYHIFLFPFQWDFKKEGKSLENMDFLERTTLENVDALLDKSCWEREYFTLDHPLKFNEYIYFYDFVRGALYDSREKPSGIQHQYSYLLPGNARFIIRVKNNQDPYDLKIAKIRLNLYTTGVGILSFHLSNQTYPRLQQILEINEFGRRIYPQFLAEGLFTEITKEKFLADRLEIVIDENREYHDDFSYFNNIERVQENPFRLSAVIMNLLGDSFITHSQMPKKNCVLISPILDDRMFVLCWLADKSFCRRLAKYDKKSETYGYVENDDWFKLVFVDKEAPSCNSIPMKKKLLIEHTYDRWIGTKWSSLFGVTRYSFILLNDDPGTFVKDHIKTMYTRMVQLALVQRASILRFSAEATRISDMKEPGKTTEKVSELQKKYLQFINKIYFREITAFDQGIDLYEKITRAMKIERDVKELDQEIEELRHYASLQEEKRHNRQLHLLTILGSLFLIPGFIIGFFGMNIFSNQLAVNAPGKLWVIIGSIVLVSFFSWLVITLRTKWPEKMGLLRKLALVVLILVVVLVLMILISGGLFTLIGVKP